IGFEFVETVGVEFLCDGCELFRYARLLACEAHEDKAAPDLGLDGPETVAFEVEPLERLGRRNRLQCAIQRIGETVIAAADKTRAMAGRAIDETERAVATEIVKGADISILAAHDDRALGEQVETQIVAGFRDVAEVADQLPRPHENRFAFEREELVVRVGPGGQGFPAHASIPAPTSKAKR